MTTTNIKSLQQASGKGFGVDSSYVWDFWRANSGEAQTWSAEHRLIAAILDDAIFVLREGRAGKYKAKWKRDDWVATEQWLEDDTADGVFSLVSICGYLGIEPQALRSAIKRQVGELALRVEGSGRLRKGLGIHTAQRSFAEKRGGLVGRVDGCR